MEISRLTDLLAQIRTEPLALVHLNDIADLHFKELSWSFNGQFGPEHILELYKTLFQSKHFFGYACYDGGRLLGCITGTTDYFDIRNLLVNVYRKKKLAMMKIFLRHPWFFLAALESKLVVPLVFKWLRAKGEVLTLLTDTTRGYIGPLVALKLVGVINEHFSSAGMEIYVGQGFRDNPKAIRYYKKLMWRVVVRLLVHNIYVCDTRISPAVRGSGRGLACSETANPPKSGRQ